MRDAIKENVTGPVYESFGKPIRALALGTMLPGDVQKKLVGEEDAREASTFSSVMECLLGVALLSGWNPYGLPILAEGGARLYAVTRYKTFVTGTPVGLSVVELPYRGAKAIYKNYFANAGKESEHELADGKLEQYSANVNPK